MGGFRDQSLYRRPVGEPVRSRDRPDAPGELEGESDTLAAVMHILTLRTDRREATQYRRDHDA